MSALEVAIRRRDFGRRPKPAHRTSATSNLIYFHVLWRWTLPAIFVAVLFFAFFAGSHWVAWLIGVAVLLFGLAMPFVVARGSRTASKRDARPS